MVQTSLSEGVWTAKNVACLAEDFARQPGFFPPPFWECLTCCDGFARGGSIPTNLLQKPQPQPQENQEERFRVHVLLPRSLAVVS